MQLPTQPLNDPIGQIPPDLTTAGLRANHILYLSLHAIDQLFGQNYAMKNPALLGIIVGVVERGVAK